MKIFKSTERISSTDISDNYVFQRCLKAYIIAEEYLSGDVLELGCGEAYYVRELSGKCNRYIAVDKYKSPVFETLNHNVEFIKMKIPPLQYIAFNSYDVVLCFQVVEHIRDDNAFVKDIYRVLKPGGTLLLSTPNKALSLTDNPWHVREYSRIEIQTLLESYFPDVTIMGICGNENVMEYYEKNKKSVQKIKRLDLFDLHSRLPRLLKRGIYTILNNRNRRNLMNKNKTVTSSLSHSDFWLSDFPEMNMLDFFCLARK